MVSLWLLIIGFVSLFTVSPAITAFDYYSDFNLAWMLRIVSHMVSHANIYHLLGNFLFGLPFMLYAEYRLNNWKTFVKLFFYCGLFALLGQRIVELYSPIKSSGVIGSSGAIFGIVAFALTIANETKPLRILSLATLAFYTYTQAEATWFSIQGSYIGIAYGAHLGGILSGIAAAFFIRRRLRPYLPKDRQDQSRSQKRRRDALDK